MIAVTLQQLTEILSAEQTGIDCLITDVMTDTRSRKANSVFVALKGERFDGHDFATEAVAAGAVALLVSKLLPINVPQVLVNDTRIALGYLAAWVRRQVNTKVVALTGSSGKTSVKEMTAAILRECGQVLSTEGNFNNDIGVPLTLLRLQPTDDFAVIELGANHIGEIAYTTSLVQPQSVLVNNLSAAHVEGFGSLAGIGKAKGEIFEGLPEDGTAIINADSNDWSHWKTQLKDQFIWRFSIKNTQGVEFFASDVHQHELKVTFTLHSPQGTSLIELPLLGKHNIANALAASALAMSVGATLDAVRIGLQKLKPVLGRLFPVILAEDQWLLDDTYNANVGSMLAAVQVLAEMPGYRVMVVGDMAELGKDTESYHRQIGEVVRLASIDKVLSVGVLSQYLSSCSGCGEHFQDHNAVIKRLFSLLSEQKKITILIKGSRSAAMEQVVYALQEKTRC